MHLPKVPAACAELDLARVSRVLAKHLGDIPRSAQELRLSIPDLKRLTWARPKLLEEAELERMGVIARAMSVVIQAVYSDDPRRQMWGCDRIMSSWLPRGRLRRWQACPCHLSLGGPGRGLTSIPPRLR